MTIPQWHMDVIEEIGYARHPLYELQRRATKYQQLPQKLCNNGFRPHVSVDRPFVTGKTVRCQLKTDIGQKLLVSARM